MLYSTLPGQGSVFPWKRKWRKENALFLLKWRDKNFPIWLHFKHKWRVRSTDEKAKKKKTGLRGLQILQRLQITCKNGTHRFVSAQQPTRKLFKKLAPAKCLCCDSRQLFAAETVLSSRTKQGSLWRSSLNCFHLVNVYIFRPVEFYEWKCRHSKITEDFAQKLFCQRNGLWKKIQNHFTFPAQQQWPISSPKRGFAGTSKFANPSDW